ncbi:hypothetical protein ACRALDRAFT_2041356 [Sodiomyces alcalophilus JCM 7366]|uniref:uncharacterized protein n=1 Tax=Sodiomyces alcalophilus JCM 7366 TaxID=591952 RepID=UPI0039B6A50A
MAMIDHQYLTASNPFRPEDLSGDIPGSCSSAAQPATYVSTPYTTITTFNLTQHCDSSLPTPISGAGSPPMHQRSEFMHGYPSATSPHSQQPTAPSSPGSANKMYWNQGFDMTAPPSQTASPMSIPAPTSSENQFDMNYILADGQATKEDIPEPPEPYFGSFGVSSSEPEGVATSQHLHHQGYYSVDSMHMDHMNSTLTPSTLAIKEETDMDLDARNNNNQHHHQQQQHQHHHHHHNTHHVSRAMMHSIQTPLPSQPNPHQFRPQQHLVANPGNEDPQAMAGYGVPRTTITSSPRIRRSQPSAPRSFKKPRVRARVASLGRSGGGHSPGEDGSGGGDAQQNKGPIKDQQGSGQQANAAEPLRFKDGIPETDRYLFELRQKYDDNKGKGMWDPIAADYNQRFGVSFDRAALQMRLSRAKSKWVQWSERDDHALIEAARQVEQQYYRQVHLKYKELGGNPQADFNVGNIEMRMVDLGLADVWMEAWKGDPKKMPIRRRRKLNERQRSSAAASRNEGMNTGAGGQTSYLPHHPGQQQQQQPSYDEFAPSRISTFPTVKLTPEEHERVLADIENRNYPLEGSASPEAASGDEDGVAAREVQPQAGAQQHEEASQRVAKQACDDMLRKSGNGIGRGMVMQHHVPRKHVSHC